MKRQLKKSVVYSLYGISFALLVGGVIGLGLATKKVSESEFQYVSKGILDYEEEVKVVNTSPVIARPYTDQEVNVVKSYYDYKAEAASQENSLIYYEDTYMQSSGVSYSKGDVFDVVSILDGTVTEVKEDTTLGNVITIEHENGIVSVYQSVSDIQVKENDVVTSGQILAKSSTSNISTELDNHLYFELIVNGTCVNPENYYDKSVNEIEG
ncbi:MAG: peptidoglycan DD-metalloendopeptidase family protein [Bacilli bacterium]|nr:peptidoglycan DD-metalloendopeptidase family protein [Bacilli bacterium]